ncbi:MAG: LysR family transcriptional regulator, hca operon transcriptional activator [Acetobacteraceae bacterium]|nr:LysR family transcriptional regulator, hca operon transcriptional activator [Acetobacteraceae bacterium]
MELRHLRYFVAIAEEGSFTQAAEKRLHTAQPSLSRQIRDLEATLGLQLIIRNPRGMELTPAGQVFLDHARTILAQVETAIDAARRVAGPAKASFTVGFLTGHEIGWLPKVLEILREELERTELIIHSASSPDLMQALIHRTMDVAFLRPDRTVAELEFRHLVEEDLFALLPAGHRLVKCKAIRAEDLRGETFISFSATYSPVLRHVIDDYLMRSGVHLTPAHEAETLPMVISLALSTGGVTFLPGYMERLLPPSVVARPLRGKPPTIPLTLGYSKSNGSPLLAHFLAKADGLVADTPTRLRTSAERAENSPTYN